MKTLFALILIFIGFVGVVTIYGETRKSIGEGLAWALAIVFLLGILAMAHILENM